MAWYKTGNVSITQNSTAVTAVGTKFASNARVGDGFRGPDGKWYEIVNIASETVLGIYPAYQGLTVVESIDYTIAPLQGYNKETADRLRIITDGIQDISEDVNAAAASAASAQQSEDAAKVSETNSKTSEDAAKVSENNAKTSEDAAKVSENNAKSSEIASASSETNANTSKIAAALSATNALTSENAAKTSETNAAASEAAASTSETNALTSENAAKASELAALTSENSASTSAAMATTGATTATNAATSANEDADRAEVARDDAIAAAGTVTGNLIDMGPVDFSGGVYPIKPVVSAFWKVTVGGTATDSGETITYGIGDTLMFSKPMENFYKIDNTENVSSVAGKTGVVTLVKADVGLPNVDNTSDVNKPISTAQASKNTALDAVDALKVNISDIVNTTASTATDKPLSAAMGKYLYDLVQSNNATIVRYTYNVAQGQTVISGADLNGNTLSYVPGTVMLVELAGFPIWDGNDYTATNGTSLTLTTASELVSEISITVFGSFSVADHYTKAESDVLRSVVIAEHGVGMGYIEGLIPSRNITTTTEITFSAGSAIIQSTGKLVRATAPIVLNTSGLTTVNSWEYFYLYDSGSGVAAIEMSLTAPASPYSGNARSKTGDTSRRFIGAFKTGAGGGFWMFQWCPDNTIQYLEGINTSPFRIVTSGSNTTAGGGVISASVLVPPTTRYALTILTAGAGTTTCGVYLSNPDVQPKLLRYMLAATVSVQTPVSINLNASQQMNAWLSSGGTGVTYTIDIYGYGFDR